MGVLSWLWSYGSWIYNYLCNQYLSPLTLVWSPLRQGVLDTTLCDKVCWWLAAGRWFSPGTLVSSNNKTDRHNIIEILLKVALNTKTLTPKWGDMSTKTLLFTSVMYYIKSSKEILVILLISSFKLRKRAYFVLFITTRITWPVYMLWLFPYSYIICLTWHISLDWQY